MPNYRLPGGLAQITVNGRTYRADASGLVTATGADAAAIAGAGGLVDGGAGSAPEWSLDATGTADGLIGPDGTKATGNTAIAAAALAGVGGRWSALAAGVSPANAGAANVAALNALLATVYAAGGGVIEFASGVHVFDQQIILPYDGSVSAPKSVPITFLGAGEWWSGKSSASAANGGTVFDCRYAGADAWLMCLAEGVFTSTGITYSQRGASAHTTPYIKTTNTTLQISSCSFEGHSSKSAATADQDCIILGGTSNASFGGNGVTQPYQGYGTVIAKNAFNRIRRGVYGRVYANAAVIRDNMFWAQCGGAAAIEFDSGTTDYCVGGLIEGNLIEMVGYTVGISLTKCSQWLVAGNAFYDAQAIAQPYVKLTSCLEMLVISGAHQDTVSGNARPYVSDTSQCLVFLSASETLASTFKFLKSGVPGYPNDFGPTTFSGGATFTVIKPKVVSGSGKLLIVSRSDAEGTNPGGEIFSLNNNGGITLGNNSEAGNILNSLPTGVSWSSNGRTWGFPGITGSGMKIDTGTGGSYLDLQAYAVRYFDHTGVQSAQIGKQFGGSGLAGIGFGATNDAVIYRSAAGVLSVTGNIAAPNSTVAALPAASAALKGSTAFATNGRKSGEGAAAGTGVPVWCDGTNWKTFYDNSTVAA